MTPWQLAAMLAGHNRAHGPAAGPVAPSPDEHKARVARVRARRQARTQTAEVVDGAHGA